MPRIKYKEFLDELRKADFFSFRLVESKMGSGYAKLFISNLLRKKEIIRLKKGFYTFKKSPYLLANLLVKAYIGLGSAALIHGVWDKAVNITILTPLAGISIKPGERIIGDYKVIIRKISENMYFGYEFKKFDEITVRVSDPEKTLIDMIYFKYPFLDEILDNLLEICNENKIHEYLEKLNKDHVRRSRRIIEKIREIMKVYGSD